MKQRTLFARTGRTISATLLVFVLFSSAVIFYYVLMPMARQSAEDLAALMVLATQTWVELPPDTRADFEDELLANHGLMLTTPDLPLPPLDRRLPYLLLLGHAISDRLGEPTKIITSEADGPWFWVDLAIAERTLRIGFPQSRIGPRPPFAALLLMIGGTAIVLITTLLLVRRTTRPLARLARAATRFGKGETLKPLEEKGHQELAALARSFNRMMQQIHELLANRTTLLAGISHDLRTPLARMRLAIEMLHPQSDPRLVEGLRRDLTEMDQLIYQVLEIARGLDETHSETETIDLTEFIDGVVARFQDNTRPLEWVPGSSCSLRINATSLHRVLVNLIDNALRYGENSKINVRLECNGKNATIRILDQGPGIPDNQRQAVFQPFHRLETSRNRTTGGSGLGLAIVRQLCDAQAWRIELLPGENGGTEARLEITESGNKTD